MKSGISLSFLLFRADELLKCCLKYKIIIIFLEKSDKLNKQLSKFDNDMQKFLNNTKPLPKRIDFRNAKRVKRYIKPIFDIPDHLDYMGWPKKLAATQEIEANGNSENEDRIAGVIETIEAIENSGEMVNNLNSEYTESETVDDSIKLINKVD